MKFGKQKIFGGIFASNILLWEEKDTGEQKCFGEERYGEKIFGSKNVLGRKIWHAKFE